MRNSASAKSRAPRSKKPAPAQKKTPASRQPTKLQAAAALPPAPADPKIEPHKLIQEKVRELIRLAKEQGYVTYDDLEEIIPEGVNDPDILESVIAQLRSVEIEIIQSSDVDRVKDVRAKEHDEEEKEEK